MKTLKIYFLLMLLIQTISISAQSVISGKITNNDSSPIVGATILLSNGMDSTYITGTTSDLDGDLNDKCQIGQLLSFLVNDRI